MESGLKVQVCTAGAISRTRLRVGYARLGMGGGVAVGVAVVQNSMFRVVEPLHVDRFLCDLADMVIFRASLG